MKNKKSVIFIVILLFIIGLSVGLVIVFSKPKINKITLSETLNEDNTKTMTIYLNVLNSFKTSCKINDGKWIESKFGKCKFNVESGTYNITIKNLSNEIKRTEVIDVSAIKSYSLEGEKTYIAVKETVKLTELIDIIGTPDMNIKWESDNEEIATVEDGKVTGLKNGETIVRATTSDGKTDSIKIIVTDVIVPRKIDMKKKVIACHEYTEEEAAILDDILKTRIENKGLKTRAALIEAIRFIPLSLAKKVPYFFENGILKP